MQVIPQSSGYNVEGQAGVDVKVQDIHTRAGFDVRVQYKKGCDVRVQNVSVNVVMSELYDIQMHVVTSEFSLFQCMRLRQSSG